MQNQAADVNDASAPQGGDAAKEPDVAEAHDFGGEQKPAEHDIDGK